MFPQKLPQEAGFVSATDSPHEPSFLPPQGGQIHASLINFLAYVTILVLLKHNGPSTFPWDKFVLAICVLVLYILGELIAFGVYFNGSL